MRWGDACRARASRYNARMETPARPSARRPLECLVAGEANMDLLVDGGLPLEPGKEKLASHMLLTLGGSSGICAHNMARLGLRTGLVGVIGADSLGRAVEDWLRAAGVDIRALRRHPRISTGITIWHGRGPDRAGLTYLGSIALLSARDIPDSLLARARHLHVGAYFMQKRLHPGAPALFRRARRLHLTTSLDCNFDPEEKWDSGIRRVLPHTDVFFPNEDEAAALTGCASAPEAARALAALCRIVVVKMGAEGAYICSPEGEFHSPALKTRVVDTTGAGDTFAAGFLREFIRGANLRACARSGARAAARCVTALGGTTAFLPRR